MSKRKWITKKEVLQAIKTEPLTSGNWVKLDDKKRFNDKTCSVCAVGAVLRKAGLGNQAINDFGDALAMQGVVAPDSYLESEGYVEAEIQDYLDTEKYLHALSYKFEYQANKTGVGKRTRNILAKFVEVNFPDKIKLDPTL